MRNEGGLAIRRAAAGDLPAMLEVGSRADQLFAAHGFPQIAALPPNFPDDFRAFVSANEAWVAEVGGFVVGFAVAGPAAGTWWLKEIAVDPEHGGQGIGSALLETVAGHARALGNAEIVLSTFRSVPFNAPFYARRGFRPLEPSDAPEAWREQFLREVPPGVEPAARILMIRAV